MVVLSPSRPLLEVERCFAVGAQMMARGAKPLTLVQTDEFGTLLTQWNVVSLGSGAWETSGRWEETCPGRWGV